MDALECILTRRSVRNYTGEPVTREEIRILLDAAMSAPSAGNEQPWHFVVVEDRGLLEKIAAIHPYATVAAKAQAAVVVCGDLSLEMHPGNWVLDCAAATQNMLLAANALGLGAVWVGIYPELPRQEALAVILGLPGGVVPLALVPLGRLKAPTHREDRFNAGRIHMNVWRQP